VDTSKAKRLRSIPAYGMHVHAMDRRAACSRNILACLGDSSRFRIALLLLEGERCVTELALAVGLSQSCTTRHLQYLEREGLVRGARQGKRVVFRLRSDRARVRELLAWVTSASADIPAADLSGADIHVEAGDAAVPSHAPPRVRSRRAPAGPRAARDVALGGHRAAPTDTRKSSAENRAGPDVGGPPERSDDMEDWLL